MSSIQDPRYTYWLLLGSSHTTPGGTNKRRKPGSRPRYRNPELPNTVVHNESYGGNTVEETYAYFCEDQDYIPLIRQICGRGYDRILIMLSSNDMPKNTSDKKELTSAGKETGQKLLGLYNRMQDFLTKKGKVFILESVPRFIEEHSTFMRAVNRELAKCIPKGHFVRLPTDIVNRIKNTPVSDRVMHDKKHLGEGYVQVLERHIISIMTEGRRERAKRR